jgi:hypothetical protein
MFVKFSLPQSAVCPTATGFGNFSHHSMFHHVSYPHGPMPSPGVCSGYDDNEEAPIGCSVTNHYPVDNGVIHQ